MLRQALADAESRQQQQQQQQSHQLQYSRNQSYGALSNNSQNMDESDDGSDGNGDSQSYDDDEEYLLRHQWEDENDSDQSPTESSSSNILQKIWQGIKGCFFLVANVENLWDTPDFVSERRIQRNHCVVFFWFFILASAYTIERSTFKFLVDRTGPFRLFTVEMVTFSHALMIGIGMLITAISRRDFQLKPLGIPVVDVGIMALLDTVNLLLVFLTGMHVAPAITVILVQFTLPLTALLTQFLRPDGCGRQCCYATTDNNSISTSPPNNNNNNNFSNNENVQQRSTYNDIRLQDDNNRIITNSTVEGTPLPGCGGLSMEHVLGSVVITLAVLLALFPAFYTCWDQDFFIYADPIPIQTAYNTLLFVCSCIPAAASQLYKEHTFLQYKQPVQADYLNFLLSILQFIFATVMSPLVFGLQGLGAGDNWTELYPSTKFTSNFLNGLECFLGLLDNDVAENEYAEPATCDYSMALVFLHSFSIIAVGVAVDKIVNAGATKIMFRGVSAGIILSVISLYTYDLSIPRFSYGAVWDSLDLVSLVILVLGSEIYHRVSLQDATFQTVYPEVESFYEDE